jgi:hypothetical protein
LLHKAWERIGNKSSDMKLFQVALISAGFVAVGALSRADPVPGPMVHYAPAENLEHIDVELIDSARHEIEFAAYVLTDWPVMQALKRLLSGKTWPGHMALKSVSSAKTPPSATQFSLRIVFSSERESVHVPSRPRRVADRLTPAAYAVVGHEANFPRHHPRVCSAPVIQTSICGSQIASAVPRTARPDPSW